MLVVMVPQLGLTLANPSNSSIASDLGISIKSVEFTLTLYMVGYALSMFIAGTLADRFDARRLQSIGMLLFFVGSLACAASTEFIFLALGRFLQALGGTSATVLCRIIVQRRSPRSSRINILTSMSMVISITPSLAPLTGGFMASIVPWRVLFIFLALFSILLIPFLEYFIGQAPPEHAHFPTLTEFIEAISGALTNSSFVWYASSISLVWMTYFSFVNSSSTIVQNILGQSPISYGLLMAVPAIGYLSGSLLIKRARHLIGAVRKGIFLGAVGILMTVFVALSNLSEEPGAVVFVMSLTFIGVGATIPYAQAGLLDLNVTYPGICSGLFFFLQMVSGAIYGAVVASLRLTTVSEYLFVIVVPLSLLVILFALRILRRRP